MPYLKKLLVVDLEATCWDLPFGEAPSGQIQEIIEIGVCEVDLQTLERSKKASYLIKPTESEVSDFCTELTTITPELLEEEGIPFGTALMNLTQVYKSRSHPWASWGAWDQTIMREQCERRGYAYPFAPYHLNIAAEFAVNTGRRKTIGMKSAANCFNIEFEGTHHRGHDDAWNTAEIFIEMQRRIRAVMTGI